MAARNTGLRTATPDEHPGRCAQGPRAAAAGCEVSRALGTRIGLPAPAVDALDDVYERWDGLGIPGGRRGEQISAVARIVHVAEQAVFAHADGGVAGVDPCPLLGRGRNPVAGQIRMMRGLRVL